MITIQTNLDRLSDMTLVQFGRTLDQCTMRQIEQAVECIMAEDDHVYNEDAIAIYDELIYHGYTLV